jgi:hypothetical protein
LEVKNREIHTNTYKEGPFIYVMKFEVAAHNENFNGMSYGEWAAAWNNWLVSSKPIYDGGRMLFLRGNIDYRPAGKQRSGPRFLDPSACYDRTGSKGEDIFEGTAIFIPVITASWSISNIYDGRLIENEQELRYFVNKDLDEGGTMWAKIRNHDSTESSMIVKDIRDYRIESPVFRLRIPRGSLLNNKMEEYVKPGIYDTVVGGYFILLKSLPLSRYRIAFGGKGRGPYYTNAIYDISVLKKPKDKIRDVSATVHPGHEIYA